MSDLTFRQRFRKAGKRVLLVLAGVNMSLVANMLIDYMTISYAIPVTVKEVFYTVTDKIYSIKTLSIACAAILLLIAYYVIGDASHDGHK